jgi:hypothetical protein
VAVLRAAALAALVCAACSLGGGDGGGMENLPISGVGPYRELSDPNDATPIEEPYVLIDPVVDVADPAPLPLVGGGYRLFFTRGGHEIWRADLASLSEAPGPAMLVLGDASAPAVMADAGGLHIYFQSEDGIARATSIDGGFNFTVDGPVLDGATQPGVTRVDDRIYLYYTRPGAPGIFVATSDDGLSFTEAPAPALAPRAGRFDAAGVGEPCPVGAVTPAGELHIGLFYVGTDATGLAAVGYAGSYDGRSFTATTQPVLDPRAPSEHGPAAVLEPTRAVLFFSVVRAGRSVIAAATSP